MNRRHDMFDRLLPDADGKVDFEEALEYVEALDLDEDVISDLKSQIESLEGDLEDAEGDSDELAGANNRIADLEAEIEELKNAPGVKGGPLTYAAWWLVENEFPRNRSEMSREQMDLVDALEATGNRVYA